ncbi:MAG TPA: asparagine synthase (glutamine-hydrolyzing) [Solirubrobacterales bacterium]|nr:asparagine synthase (glutamine-hydrolyzing) [Solirubrobacterales bacterium]
MCGICGLARLDGSRNGPDPETLAAMNATLRHRGPDSEGITIAGPVGLAARRLSIIDLDHGDQPLTNEDGTIHVVQNGEIYNYRELREELGGGGHELRTHCDTEVLVHLYEDEGPGFVERLRGMFAIAIWDEPRQRLVLARDRFGIKPLYWGSVGGTLAFASELRALQRISGFDHALDPDALESYLAFNSIPAPLTIFATVRKLGPGEMLLWSSGGEPSVHRYSRPAPVPAVAVRTESEPELARELLDRLSDSVRAHLVADVPVGVLLSGGVDSSTIAALAATSGNGAISTFSIGFEEGSFDELDRARAVARRFGTDHHELVVRPDAVALLPRLVAAFDEPFGDSSALPTYLVAELAARSVKVVLSGEGGDELLGGYYTYVADRIAPWLRAPARLARPVVEALPSSTRKASFDYKAKRFVRAAHLPPLERHHAWKEIFSPDARVDLLGGADAATDPLDFLRRRYAETEGAEPLARLQDVDLGIYLVDDLLVKTDRASMTHSLEARVPFLDPEVADFALAVPRRALIRGLQKKRLLRRAVRGLLPREVVDGPKQGFSAPVAAWLRGEMHDFARDALAPSVLRRHGYLDPAAVEALLERHRSGAEDLSRQIWGLLALTLWQEANVGSSSPPIR